MLNKEGTTMKKLFKCIGLIILIGVSFIIFQIVLFRPHTIDNIQVKGDSITYEKPKKIEDKYSVKWDSIQPLKTRENLVDDIVIHHEGSKIKGKLYEKDLRYYINLNNYISQIGGTITKENDKEIIIYNNKKIEINKSKKTYSKQKETLHFRGEVLNINGLDYISINDIEGMLDLRDTWNTKNRTIHIYNDKNYTYKNSISREGEAALVRIEDITAGSALSDNTSKEKMKVLADNLYSKGVKFHIAWVPRYKNPKKDIDNDLLTQKTMDNVQFINMLDHLIQKGGVIGLHGYTHQYGNETSLEGFELTRKINSTEEETRKVIESAIVVAKTLNIPIGFFESPHYGATRKQQRIIEEYFEILYEPYAGYYNANPLYSFMDKNRLYVPAMYGYVKDKNGDKIVRKIKGHNKFVLKSFFIHPYMELGFIKFKEADETGYNDYIYDDKSPLNSIIKALDEAGCTTINVTELSMKE